MSGADPRGRGRVTGAACVGALLGLPGAQPVVAQAAAIQPVSCPAPKAWPAKLRIEYDVTATRGPFSLNGESVLRFDRKDAGYSITVETDSAIYHARQTSRGSLDASGLRPDEYVEERSRRAPATTTFDWSVGRVSFSVAPDTIVETHPGLQDRATLPLQLAWMQRGTPAASSFELWLTGSRSVGQSRFARQAPENVKVTAGAIDAVRFERAADSEHDKIEAWFSADWCGLPVRIRYTDKHGSVIDHRMRSLRIE